ncbi:MAG: hypothetical protein MJK04_00655 [Psychrosphaera sp.]|nr:hypothetical protein [Psychrosphaera sp.]
MKHLLAVILVLAMLWYITNSAVPNQVTGQKPTQSKVIEQSTTQQEQQTK